MCAPLLLGRAFGITIGAYSRLGRSAESSHKRLGSPLRRRDDITLCNGGLRTNPMLDETRLTNVPSRFQLYCANCNAALVVARRTLYTRGIFAQLTCQMCAVNFTARKWLCDCNRSSVGCMIHAQTGFTCHRDSLCRAGANSALGIETFPPSRVRKRVHQQCPSAPSASCGLC